MNRRDTVLALFALGIAPLAAWAQQPVRVVAAYLDANESYVNPNQPATEYTATLGGNYVMMLRSTKLRTYWDSNAVKRAMTKVNKAHTLAECASELLQLPQPIWQTDGDIRNGPKKWVDEFMPVASNAYTPLQFGIRYKAQDRHGDHPQWDVEYKPSNSMNQAREATNTQLTKTGYRLAAVLNQIWPAERSTSEVPAPKGEVLASGICEKRSEPTHYDLPQSTAGYAGVADVVITEETETVPLRKNIGFGFTWRATGLPEEVHVTYVITHPPITRPDGLMLEGFEEPYTHKAIHGTVETTDCNFLSEDHELVPGTWTISIVYNGATLVERSYRVQREQCVECRGRPQEAGASPSIEPRRQPSCTGSYNTTTWTNCSGELTFPNGDRYVGEWKDGKPNGQGTLRFPDERKSPDGRKYVGEFKDGVYNGQGALTFRDGMKYVGEYSDGLRNGQGIEYDPNGSILNSGTWKNGTFIEGR